MWDLLAPKPRRGGASYLLPPFSYVAKEHGSVAIGAARRALDELIKIATTTRGTFRSSKLDERQVVHRQIAEADLKLRAARALMHERYGQLWEKVNAGGLPDGADIADVRAIAVYATDIGDCGLPPWPFIFPARPACTTRTSSAGCCAILISPASIR